MSADNSAIKYEMPRLKLAIANYAHADVWNAQEIGLFYRQPPSWTFAPGPVCGSGMQEVRIPFLSCCINDGL